MWNLVCITEIAQHISIADEIDVAGINVQPEHQTAICEIEDHHKKTINDLWNRLQNMVNWIQDQYSQHYPRACIPPTQQLLADKKQYHKQKTDFICSKINIKTIQVYLSLRINGKNKMDMEMD